MRIDGRLLAQKIFTELKREVKKLNTKPHLAVILVGEDPVWKVYVGQKLKKGEEIGAKVTIKNYESGISNKELIRRIKELNRDPHIHGIIVQRPLPPQLDKEQLALAVNPKRDVDGFHPKSYYPMPVAAAVLEILEKIYQIKEATGNASRGAPRGGPRLLASGIRVGLTSGRTRRQSGFINWLKTKNIVVIGKGETAGKPTATSLNKLGAIPTVIDSKAPDPEKLIKRADIVISCVGKPKIVRPEIIKKGVILIGVGLHRDPAGKLAGDYDEEKIKDIASFYTPVPGGVGPVNVACLLKNLVDAASS